MTSLDRSPNLDSISATKADILLDAAAEAQVQGLDDGAAADAEEVAEGLVGVQHEREDIGAGVGRGSDDGLRVVLLQRPDLLLVHLGVLELQPLRRLGHQGLVVADDFPAPARQDPDDFLDVVGVLLLGDLADAGGLAAADVEVQAGPELSLEDGLGGDVQVAGAQGIGLAEEVHEVPRVHHAAVGTEIPVPMGLVDAPGDEHPRELVPGHADPGIGLGILQEDVVAGLVLLDEVVLQQQGIGLRVHDGVLRVGDLGHEDACLRGQPLRRHEVLRDPLVQVLRLPHIDDIPRGVIIPVDARGMRKQGYFLAYCHSEPEGRRIYSPKASFTASPIASPRRFRLRIVPSGPKRMTCGMASMP